VGVTRPRRRTVLSYSVTSITALLLMKRFRMLDAVLHYFSIINSVPRAGWPQVSWMVKISWRRKARALVR
jgi:hypothetical protein